MSSTLAALHYLSLGIGFAGISLRQYALSQAKPQSSVKSLYLGDNLWGVAALSWIATGLLRAFGGFEKGTAFYLSSPWFHTKMALFLLVFLLELYPMITFIKWRISKKVYIESTDLKSLRTFKLIGIVEIGLLVVLIFVASAMSRGVWLF